MTCSDTPVSVPARPDGRERVEEEVGVRDHQVRLEGETGDLAKRADKGRTHGKVGHELSVHHVNMDPVGAGCFSLRHLLTQAGEVSRENRWP